MCLLIRASRFLTAAIIVAGAVFVGFASKAQNAATPQAGSGQHVTTNPAGKEKLFKQGGSGQARVTTPDKATTDGRNKNVTADQYRATLSGKPVDPGPRAGAGESHTTMPGKKF
jgi:hypothetical protein